MDVKEEKKSPVYNVIAVPVEKVTANDYNPNVVAPPEMKLLELDIEEYMNEVLLDHGFRKTQMAVAEAGLSELLTEDLEKAEQKN